MLKSKKGVSKILLRNVRKDHFSNGDSLYGKQLKKDVNCETFHLSKNVSTTYLLGALPLVFLKVILKPFQLKNFLLFLQVRNYSRETI